MSENDGLLDEFLSEVNDKYYPQVMEGLAQLYQGRTGEAVETLSRPLHTIKGVTGFIPGFEPASLFTHEVESFLKKLQSGEVADTPDNCAVAAQAVTSVFNVIDQIKQTGQPLESETESTRAALHEAQKKPPKLDMSQDQSVEVLDHKGLRVIRLRALRLHLAAQRQAVIEVLAATPPGAAVLLDFSGVVSAGSALWEDILPLADILCLAVTGLDHECRGVFHTWGFDRYLTQWPSESAFLASRTESP